MESIQRVFRERSSERDAFRVQECTRWHWLLMMYEGRHSCTVLTLVSSHIAAYRTYRFRLEVVIPSRLILIEAWGFKSKILEREEISIGKLWHAKQAMALLRENSLIRNSRYPSHDGSNSYARNNRGNVGDILFMISGVWKVKTPLEH
jgi:hypothetical protein